MRTALRRLRATDRSVNAVNPATRLPNTCLERALRYRYVLNMPENGKTRDERGFEALESSSGGFVHLDRRPRPDEARDFDGDLRCGAPYCQLPGLPGRLHSCDVVSLTLD